MADQFTREKTPEAILDYGFDWRQWLSPGDQLSTAEWIITPFEPDGLYIVANVPTPTHAIVWLGGGILGNTYEAKCIISTAEGREDARVLMVTITYEKT